jgi:hypothetical protein
MGPGAVGQERQGQEEEGRGLLDKEKSGAGACVGFVYGPRHEYKDEYVLDIAEDIRPRREWSNERHPNGKYSWIDG